MFVQEAKQYFEELIRLSAKNLCVYKVGISETEDCLAELKNQYPDVYSAYANFTVEYLAWEKIDKAEAISVDAIVQRDSLLQQLVRSVNKASQ